MRMFRALCTAADCSCCRLLLLRLCDRFMMEAGTCRLLCCSQSGAYTLAARTAAARSHA